jgi:hypothetical protein
MKEIKIEGIYTMFKYETEDGDIFFNSQAALDHEKAVRLNRIFGKMKRHSFDDIYADVDWYYVSNEEELKTVIEHYGVTKNNCFGNLVIGEWFCYKSEDYDEGYKIGYNIYTLSWVKEQLNKILFS